jgi:ACS family D-galactonate transporter-like MFS transporter
MLDDAKHGVPHARLNGVVALLTLSILINYVDRTNLSIAAPLLQDELHISNTQLGTLLAAFFWTYALMQIPAGWLADRFDVKWVFATGFLLWTTATAVTSLLHSFAALVAIRVVLGLGESVAFPSYSNIIANYFPETRRGFPNALVMAGLSLGPTVGIFAGASLIGHFGWRRFFLALGLAGLLWLVPWVFLMPRRASRPAPARTPSISVWRILRQRSAWGTCLGQFSLNYYLYFLVTWLPTYLKRARAFTMDDVAKYGSLLFLMSAVSATAWGLVSDRWLSTGATVTQLRKGSLIVGQIGVGICLVLTAFTQGRAFIVMLALTGVFLGLSCCSTWAISQTLAGPLAAGRWAGVQNCIGNFAGWVAPMLTGFLLDRTGSFLWPFFITATVACLGALGWGVIVGRVEPVDWEKAEARNILSSRASCSLA